MELPVNYTSYMKKLLGDEYNSYIESFNKESFHGLRVNRLKINGDKFNDLSPFKLTRIPFIDNGFIYGNNENPAKDAYYHAGLYYLQEPSAMLPANRLPIEEGDKVLDLCAAPGGKATELAGKLNGTGLLYANDISASRALALLKNLELTGAGNIYVTAETPEKLANKLPNFFDKILCDVPCSGEGMFRKDSSLIKSWIEKQPEDYIETQRSILESAYNLLADGGMIMYSTCTFDDREDEGNIADFLDHHSDMSLIDIEGYEGFEKGINGLDKCVRIYPHKVDGEGHFLALMKKEGHSIKNPCTNDAKIITKPSKDKKSTVEYKLPAYKDNGFRDGIRYLRTGLMLSMSQHFAMSLNENIYENHLNLNRDDVRTIKYLKGETLFLQDNESLLKGDVLVLVDGFSLGFAKHDGNGKLKNMYNAGWRMS